MLENRSFGLGLLLALAAVWADPALAQHMNAPDRPTCPGPRSTASDAACFEVAYRESDHKLNEVFQQVLKTLAPQDQAALRSAQLLWLKFRDANCEVEHGLYKGGTAAPMVLTACLEAETRHRTDDLLAGFGYRLQR